MKPEGRSLDVAVVGLGQAGGNIAAEFFRRGYRAMAFNTAQTDLIALDPGGVYPTLPADRRVYIGLDGYDGAGADPAYGKECIAENAERIRTAVVKMAAQADVLLLAAGLGGWAILSMVPVAASWERLLLGCSVYVVLNAAMLLTVGGQRELARDVLKQLERIIRKPAPRAT